MLLRSWFSFSLFWSPSHAFPFERVFSFSSSFRNDQGHSPREGSHGYEKVKASKGFDPAARTQETKEKKGRGQLDQFVRVRCEQERDLRLSLTCTEIVCWKTTKNELLAYLLLVCKRKQGSETHSINSHPIQSPRHLDSLLRLQQDPALDVDPIGRRVQRDVTF